MRTIMMRNGISRYLIAILMLFGLNNAFATNYYIDAVSGNDGNNGTSQTSAWRTIGKVNSSTFQPGDSILFRSGQRWAGTGLNLNNYNGALGNPIVIGKYGGETKPILSRLHSSGSIIGGSNSISFVTVQDLELRGSIRFTLYGWGTYPSGTHDLKFLRLTVDGNASGDVTQSGGFTFYADHREVSPETWQFNEFFNLEFGYNIVKNTTGGSTQMIHIWGLTENLWIHHNEFTNGRGFIDVSGGDNITIEHNRMVGSTIEGMKLQVQNHTLDNLIVRGNLIAGTTLQAIRVFLARNAQIYNNTFRNNPSPGYQVAEFGIHPIEQGMTVPYMYMNGKGTYGFEGNYIENNIFIGQRVIFYVPKSVSVRLKDGSSYVWNRPDIWENNYFNNNLYYNYSDEYAGHTQRIAYKTYETGTSATWDANNSLYVFNSAGSLTIYHTTDMSSFWESKENVSNEIWMSDPKFVNRSYNSPLDYGDYKLKEDSPARETGIIIPEYLYDLLGNIIPASTNPDRGAFQSSNSILNPDITPPNLLGAEISSTTYLLLSFSEPIQSAEAQDKNNFVIDNGITVTNATLLQNNTQVALTTTEHISNSNYTITVSNLKDLSNNKISSLNNSIQYFFEGSSGRPVINTKVYLEGPYSDNLMSADLRENGLIPMSQPYTLPPWNYSPFGANLFKDGRGDYESSAGSWVAYGNNLITISNEFSNSGSNSFKLTYNNQAQGAHLYLNSSADLSSNLTVGEKYKVIFWGKVNSGSLRIRLRDALDGTIPDYSSTLTSSTARHEIEFTATSATMNYLRFESMTTGQIAFIDNISLHAVTGESEVVPSIPDNIIDWVLVELRTGTAASTTVARRAAFIRNDGVIVDIDGSSKVAFPNIEGGDYYLVIKHRNHLAVMSKLPIGLTDNSELYDFTTGSDKAYGTEPMADLGNGKFGLFAGDGDSNGIINVLDYGSVGNFIFQNGYLSGDLDMNHTINVLDYGKSSSTMFKTSQVPN